jgi:hypothetical protein
VATGITGRSATFGNTFRQQKLQSLIDWRTEKLIQSRYYVRQIDEEQAMSRNELESFFRDRRLKDRRRDPMQKMDFDRREGDRRGAEFSTQPWWLQRSVLDSGLSRR